MFRTPQRPRSARTPASCDHAARIPLFSFLPLVTAGSRDLKQGKWVDRGHPQYGSERLRSSHLLGPHCRVQIWHMLKLSGNSKVQTTCLYRIEAQLPGAPAVDLSGRKATRKPHISSHVSRAQCVACVTTAATYFDATSL